MTEGTACRLSPLPGFSESIPFGEYRRYTLHQTVKITDDGNLHTFEFLLPTHKTNLLFHSSSILIQACAAPLNPKSVFTCYLTVCDSLFPFLPLLWLCKNSLPPSHSWFINKLHSHFPPEISGHSFCSGGVMHLTLAATGYHIKLN